MFTFYGGVIYFMGQAAEAALYYKARGVKMYELIQVTDKTYYIQSPAKIGLCKLNDTDVCLIDSGNDKEAGRKVRQILDKNGWSLKAIYNTHSNADHIGGNKYLQNQTHCRIFAPGIECGFTRRPILEPSFLYGGNPPEELRRKFLMAQESDAEYLTPAALPDGFGAIDLHGHFFDMAGYRTADNVVFLADCLSSRETLDKYKIGFIYDVGAYIETLENVKTMQADMFIPSHAEAAEDITELAQYNIDKTLEAADKICDTCREPKTAEEVLKCIFDDYGLQMTFEQHALVGSTVRSYLTYLKEVGEIDVLFENNMLRWVRI